jgi:hypothetical protein
MVGFHHAARAENVRLGRNDSATRLEGEDATVRKLSCLACRYVELRDTGRVNQLVEARVKFGISQQSILVTPHVVEHDAPLSGGDDQSSLFVDEVSYCHFPSHLSRSIR